MDKKLFGKISKIIIKASLIAIVIMIFFCSVTIKQYFFKLKLDEIRTSLSNTLKDYKYNDDKLYNDLENKFSDNLIIRCYDTSEEYVFDLYNCDDKSKQQQFSKNDVDRALNPYIKTVLSGNSVKGVTKLYGLEGDVILIGEPIKSDKTVTGAVFIIKFTKEFSKSLAGLYLVLMISVILVLVSTSIPIYILIKKLFKPLGDMTKATIAMAGGDYSVRIKDIYDDDMGELIKAFNNLASKLEVNDQEAKLLEQMRRDYVANISHELKTPITSIRAVAETLNDDLIVDRIDKKKYYSMILRESMRLETLIKDMLELSRLQSKNISLEKSYVNLKDIVEEVYEKFEVISQDLGIDFIVDSIKEDIPSIFTNYNRIIQVLIILLDNAFKFTDEDGIVKLNIKYYTDYINISVLDTGVGINNEDIPFVFDRFYKADKARTSGGTGIGLSIAKEIISNLNEDIYVESDIGKGSTFTFTIHYN